MLASSSSTSDERNATRSVAIVVRRYSSVTSRIVSTCALTARRS